MKLQLFAALMMSVATLGNFVATSEAAPVDLVFAPPSMPATQRAVCATRSSDGALVEKWTKWSRKSLPKGTPRDILRDMNRLRDLDAKQNKDVVLRIIDLLPQIKKDYSAADALSDRIKLLVAAGETATVRDQKMVSRLIAMGVDSPKTLSGLADFVTAGLAPDVSAAQALQMKVKAALQGNPEAMLEIVERVEAGEVIAGWSIDSKMAVTLAFGSLIGDIDSTICDRIGRVARAYEGGKIVAENRPLAVQWHRLAADFGDDRAAWRVAQYYLEGEFIEADADVLFKYLNRAVDAKIDTAVVTLAGMYEDGALVEQHFDKAIGLYDEATRLNHRTALVRKLKLLVKIEKTAPKYAEMLAQTLQQVVAKDDAPAWSVMRQSRFLQQHVGYWASIAQSRPLLEKAASAGDAEAKIDLAELLIAENESAADVKRAVDLLAQVVKSDGNVRAVEDLVRYYSCSAPHAQSKDYWTAVKDAMGNDTVDIPIEMAAKLSNADNQQEIAALQTQSLYGRGSAIAVFRRYLAQQPDSRATQDFWASRVEETPDAELDESYAAFQVSMKKGDIAGARSSIKATGNDYSPDVGLTFAKFLLESYANDPSAKALAREILLPLANKGYGRTIQLLLTLDDTKKLADFEDVMKSRGDMVSQLMLAETAKDVDLQKLYMRRAVGSQGCDFNDAVTMGEYALRLDPSQAARWLETAIVLSKSNQWLRVKVADLYMSAGSETGAQRALELYKEGHEAQENSASYRLVKFYSDKTRRDYNPQLASDIFVDLIERSELKDLPERLAMLDNMKQDIRRQVTLRLNVPELYRKAAEASQPVAMREYGKILRAENAAGSARQSFNWFLRAANLADAESMFLVSQSYAFGLGVKASNEMAQSWLEKSANAGFEDAVKLRSYVSAGTEG